MRRRIALGLYYLVPALVLLGGLGDLAITELLDAQRAFLSGGGVHPVSPPAARAFLETLHAMAGGLVGVGAAGLMLTHFGIRAGHRWAAVALVVAIVCAEGANTIGMYRLGSPFYLVTAAYVALILLATGIAFAPTFVFAQHTRASPST